MGKKLLAIVFLSLWFVPMSVFAQTGELAGKVTDDATGESLPGANVYLLEIKRGASTDINGEYVITGIPAGNYTVVASYLGYLQYKQEVVVGVSNTVLDIQLKPDFLGLEELVVTGYKTMDRKTFSGKVSTVSSDKLESVPVASVDAMLQGNAAGVTVAATSGTPGSAQDIRIRGISSLTAGAQPLFVIDGVPVVNGDFSAFDASSGLGVLANLNPSDIESVTILKDAVSTAPYGARGTNGVVVIKTKEGRFGKTQYNVRYQRGNNDRAIDGPGAMNASQWNDYFTARFGVSSGPDGLGWWDGETDTDWGRETINEGAVQQEFGISAQGGNQDTKFFLSSSFFGQEGQAVGSSLDRISGKLDVSHKLSDGVKVQNSFTGSFVEQDGFLEGSSYFGSPVFAEFAMLPIDPVNLSNGSRNIDSLNGLTFHPLYLQENDINRNRTSRILNNTKIDFELAENLSFTTRFGIDLINTEQKSYANRNHGGGVNNNGEVEDVASRNFNYVWQNIVSYFVQPNADNEVSVSLISETQRNYFQNVYSYAVGFAADGLVNQNSAATPQATDGVTTDWASQAFMALVNYGFKEKAFLDLSYRYEGNSRFSDDNRWGGFYSVGVSYVLSEESFMKNLDFINNLKIRSSYGLTGNANVGLNVYQATVGFGGYNDRANILINQLGNNALTWELAQSFDVGVDFELFNKISGSLTYYNKVSSDLLYNVPLSRTTGHASQTQNIGELFNRGFEMELNVDVVRTKNFAWNIGGNLATLENEVTKLPVDGNGETITDITGTRYNAVEGFAVGTWHMREWAGVDSENGDPLWYIDEVDANGNVTGRTTTNNYTAATRYSQGANALPTITAGLNTRIDVKGFYASAVFYYAGGNKVYDSWGFVGQHDGQFASALGGYADLADYWTPENPNAVNPRPGAFALRSNAASTRYLYDGDFIRLRTLNVGYNLPSSLVKQIGFKSGTIFFVGQNLWTHVFDDRLKFDPEVNATGFLDFFGAPMKSITGGINLNF